MKKCPQCSTVYEEEVLYCLKDGMPLEDFEETAPPDDEDEPEKIIRNTPPAIDFENAPREQKPIVIDFSKPETPAEPATVPVVTVVKEAPEKTSKYGIFLIVGLLLGGATVLAGMFAARNFYGGNSANAAKEEKININLPADKNSSPAKNPEPEKTETASAKHGTQTAAPDADFNGRVISLNAYVRSAPSKTASETDILPMDDRIKIKDRANPNSPWYSVVCEHGTSGWMHGDTIEFTK